MKDLETTWSHIVGRKLQAVREDRWMTLQELWQKAWYTFAFVWSILWRRAKWSEDHFLKIGSALGIPETQIRSMMHESLLEAIEEEYGIGIRFALKTKYKLSDKWVSDVMKFLHDLAEKDEND